MARELPDLAEHSRAGGTWVWLETGAGQGDRVVDIHSFWRYKRAAAGLIPSRISGNSR
jgi:hypothetical protein